MPTARAIARPTGPILRCFAAGNVDEEAPAQGWDQTDIELLKFNMD